MNAERITALTVEEAPQRLWHEWLSGYFDGGTHAVGGVGSVEFPRAALAFDVGALPQPLEGIGITVLAETTREAQFLGEAEGTRMFFDDVTWTFQIRAQPAAGGEGNRAYRARQTSQLLHALLQDATATLPLAQKGLMNLGSIRTMVIPAAEYAFRILRVSGQLHYESPE